MLIRKRIRQCRQLFADERGSITAEFALVLPAVIFTLALIIAGISVAALQISYITAAAQIARLDARGDDVLAQQIENQLPQHSTVIKQRDGQLLCVTVQGSGKHGIAKLFHGSARSCALIQPLH